MLERLMREIEDNGRLETYLGGKEEAIYWFKEDAWIVRRDVQGKPYSVWNPTTNLLVSI